MNLAPLAWVLENEAFMHIREAESLKYYLEQPMKEVDKETFFDMLGCLPPIRWTVEEGVERFCMSEMQSGTITSCYASYNGKYYHKYVDLVSQATFITRDLIEAMQ